MRKLLVSILAIGALGLGTASAQDAFGATVQLSPDYYAGINVGLVTGAPSFGLHFGINDLFTQGIGPRASLGFAGGNMGLSFDVIANLPVDTGSTPLGIYAGAGAQLRFSSSFNMALALFVGGEFRLVGANFPAGGIFAELGPSFSVTGHGTSFYLRGGFNYHF